jgi:predicted nucleic acid-binding protein
VSAPGERPDPAYADTNIFLALFAGPDHPLHEEALILFRRVAAGRLPLVLTPIVVSELVYAAAGILGWSRRATGQRLGELIQAQGLVVNEQPILARALELYGRAGGLDFPDAYLAARALEVGPAQVASFDRDLDRIQGLRRVSA